MFFGTWENENLRWMRDASTPLESTRFQLSRRLSCSWLQICQIRSTGFLKEKKRYYVAQVCPGSVEMEHNTMRQVHHILDLSVFVDMGNTIIRVWRQGRYVAQVRYGCFHSAAWIQILVGKMAPHECSTNRKRQKLLVVTPTTSTRMLLLLLLPCQAALPADVNLFTLCCKKNPFLLTCSQKKTFLLTSFVYYDPAATG